MQCMLHPAPSPLASLTPCLALPACLTGAGLVDLTRGVRDREGRARRREGIRSVSNSVKEQTTK